LITCSTAIIAGDAFTARKASTLTLSVKDLTFALSMGAVGNVLAAITIAPTMVRQVALDFSSLPVFIAAVFGGPVVGGLTGFLAGILPSAFFGFIGGQLGILGFGTSVGKAISGFSVGVLTRIVKSSQSRTALLIPIVLLGFVPEAAWIYMLFTVFIPVFIPNQAFLSAFLVPILTKALFEIVVMGVFTSAIAGHSGFRAFLAHYVRTTTFRSMQTD
jgi:LytS/YehU family sensor histidine kinase